MSKRTLFRYFGNKGRMLQHYRPPPQGTQRVVEPFLGSGAYTLSMGLPGYGTDANPNIKILFEYLCSVDPNELYDIKAWLETPGPHRAIEAEARWGLGAALYVRVNVCGIYTGQMNSDLVYANHKLPVDATLSAVRFARGIEVHTASWETALAQVRSGDLVFFDPPYFGSIGGYLGEDVFDPKTIAPVLAQVKQPVLFTYGEGAPDIFPEFEWELACVRKTPRIRSGGTVERREWAAYINWPDEPRDLFDLLTG